MASEWGENKELIWENGKKNGMSTEWWDNGQKHLEDVEK